MQKIFGAILMLAVLAASCKQTNEQPEEEVAKVEVIEKLPVLHYGFNLEEFNVVHDTVRNGDSFGELMLNSLPEILYIWFSILSILFLRLFV